MLAPIVPRPPPARPGQERELGPARGLGERVGGLRLHDAAAHLGRDPGRRLVGQRQEDPGAERLEERAPGLASGEHGAERGDRLRGDDRDAAALPGERERLLVARGIVLVDGRERLVLVADEHGGPEVASGPAGGLGGPPQQRLHPGVLEQDADGAGERGVRARGHVEREDLAALDQLAERRQPAPEARHGPDGLGVLVRRSTIHMYGFVRVRRRRTEHARDLRLIEEREEDGDAFHDRGAELGIERHPVVQVPPLDRLYLLPELAARTALALLGLERDLELPEPIPEDRVEPAGGLLGAGHRLPGPVLERLLMREQIAAGDGDPDRAEAADQIPGRADLSREQLRVDRAAVDVLQSDPAPRQEPVQPI